MKFYLLLLFITSLFNSFSQQKCEVLNYLSDTINIDGYNVVYQQNDSIVEITCENSNFKRTLPSKHSFSCQTKYIPSIPIPRWTNNDYIGFTQSGGSGVFQSFVVPLNNQDSVIYAGHYLIDTTRSIFMSLYLDSNFNRILEIKNCKSGKIQTHRLQAKDFWCTVLFDCLDYSEPHPNGFSYVKNQLTLYYIRENESKIRTLKFSIE